MIERIACDKECITSAPKMRGQITPRACMLDTVQGHAFMAYTAGKVAFADSSRQAVINWYQEQDYRYGSVHGVIIGCVLQNIEARCLRPFCRDDVVNYLKVYPDELDQCTYIQHCPNLVGDSLERQIDCALHDLFTAGVFSMTDDCSAQYDPKRMKKFLPILKPDFYDKGGLSALNKMIKGFAKNV